MANAGMSGFVSFLDSPKPETDMPARRGDILPPGIVIKSDTVSEPDTVQQTDTVQETPTVLESKPSTVQETGAVQDSYTVQGNVPTVQEPSTVKDSYTVQVQSARAPKKPRTKRTQGVEDGHSLAEQEVYRALWKNGVPEGHGPEANRIVRIGYDRLASLVRLSWVTVKTNLRSLEKKLAIEVLAAEDSASREGKQYRVYSDAAIWARRESAGLVWVRRTRGVELLLSQID